MSVLLVIVNRHAGTGQADGIVTRAVNIWKDQGIKCETIHTEYSNHAESIAHNIDLSKYAGIVSASGDGQVFQILNGLFNRENGHDAIKTPVTQLPCGSGNGLAASVLQQVRHSREVFPHYVLLGETIQIICLRTPVPHDGMIVRLSNMKPLCSFLSITFGLTALADSWSEPLRFLGSFRFTIGAIYETLLLRSHKAILYYLPSDDSQKAPKYSNKKDSTQHIEGSTAELDFNLYDYLTNEVGVELPPDDKMCSSWRRLDGPFVMFVATLKNMLASDMIVDPELQLCNDFIQLEYIKEGATRYELLSGLYNIFYGSSLKDVPCVRSLNVKALCLKCPREGLIMVDGEKFQSKWVYAEIIPGAFRTFSVKTGRSRT